MVNALDRAYIGAKVRATQKLNALASKATGDETLIIKIMLMVIAVVLVILFRDTLKSMITDLLAEVQTKVKGMYVTTPAGSGI